MSRWMSLIVRIVSPMYVVFIALLYLELTPLKPNMFSSDILNRGSALCMFVSTGIFFWRWLKDRPLSKNELMFYLLFQYLCILCFSLFE